jgi:tubulin-specific chaperone B
LLTPTVEINKMAQEKAAMRAYVTGADHLQYTQLADGMVQISATHSNLKQYVMELRLDLHSPISEVKRKLYTHNGSSIEAMELHLRDQSGNFICKMLDDSRPLGYYSVQNGYEIHVVDTDPFSLSRDGGLDDVSKIEKYRMTDEEYEKRENTLRAYKKKMLAQDPNFKFLPENKKPAVDPDFLTEECVAGAEVGMRCEIQPGSRRGVIAYIGKDVASLAPGYWVGVRLDEPMAKGDGSRGGVSYFDCPDKHGAFVRPDHVAVGNFPTIEEELGLTGGEGEHKHGEEAHCGCGSEHAAAAAASAPADAPSAGAGATAAPEAAAASAAPAAVAAAPVVVKKAANLKVRRRGQEEGDEGDSDDEL